MMPGNPAADQDDHEALPWNPDSSVDGKGYRVEDHQAELARHLPERWEVTRFEMLDPDEKNHGGGPILRLTIKHTDADANVRVTPHSTFPNRNKPRVINSQIVTRQVDGETMTVASDDEMVTRERLATVLEPVVEAAESFSERYSWFH